MQRRTILCLVVLGMSFPLCTNNICTLRAFQETYELNLRRPLTLWTHAQRHASCWHLRRRRTIRSQIRRSVRSKVMNGRRALRPPKNAGVEPLPVSAPRFYVVSRVRSNFSIFRVLSLSLSLSVCLLASSLAPSCSLSRARSLSLFCTVLSARIFVMSAEREGQRTIRS